MFAFLGLAREEVDDLSLGTEFGLEGWDVYLLDGDALSGDFRGGEAGGMADDHPGALQSQRAEGHVRVATSPWHQQVGAFFCLGRDGPVRDLIG
ncbi:MAG: hypothetical protein RL639_1268, partial [Verrucomicrobiota bacterium]